MRAFAEFHEEATPKGVYTSSDTLFRGVRTPWLLRKIASIWPKRLYFLVRRHFGPSDRYQKALRGR